MPEASEILSSEQNLKPDNNTIKKPKPEIKDVEDGRKRIKKTVHAVFSESARDVSYWQQLKVNTGEPFGEQEHSTDSPHDDNLQAAKADGDSVLF